MMNNPFHCFFYMCVCRNIRRHHNMNHDDGDGGGDHNARGYIHGYGYDILNYLNDLHLNLDYHMKNLRHCSFFQNLLMSFHLNDLYQMYGLNHYGYRLLNDLNYFFLRLNDYRLNVRYHDRRHLSDYRLNDLPLNVP